MRGVLQFGVTYFLARGLAGAGVFIQINLDIFDARRWGVFALEFGRAESAPGHDRVFITCTVQIYNTFARLRFERDASTETSK